MSAPTRPSPPAGARPRELAGSRGSRSTETGTGNGSAGTGTGLVALVSGTLFLLLAGVLVRTTVFADLDGRGSVAARSWAGRHAGSPLRGLVHLGDGASLVVVTGLVAGMASLALRRWRPFLGSAVTMIVVAVVVETSKNLLGRASPPPGGRRSDAFFAGGASFPSGHTAGTLVMLGLVASLVAGPGGVRPSRQLYWVLATGAVVLGLAVGFLTVTLGWHWPTDVAGGVLVAGVAGAIGRALVHRAPGRPDAEAAGRPRG